MLQKRKRSPAPFSRLYVFCLCDWVFSTSPFTVYICSKQDMSQLLDKHTKSNRSSMWHFYGKLFENIGHAIFKIFFSKTEDRNQWHHNPEAVYDTPRFQNVSTNQKWNSYFTSNTEMLEPWKQYVTLCGTKMYSYSNFGIQTPHPNNIGNMLQTQCF